MPLALYKTIQSLVSKMDLLEFWLRDDYYYYILVKEL